MELPTDGRLRCVTVIAETGELRRNVVGPVGGSAATARQPVGTTDCDRIPYPSTGGRLLTSWWPSLTRLTGQSVQRSAPETSPSIRGVACRRDHEAGSAAYQRR
jgi:hypothetical protein